MPLPTGSLIHPRFEQHHRPVANRQMTATCRIERPSSDTPAWDDTTGRTTYPQPTLVYEGPCRYQYTAPAGQPAPADLPTPVAEVRVVVPVTDIVFQVNDLVTLTASEHNPDIVGRRLVVTSVNGSSISWQRDLVCQLRQPTTR